MLLCAAETIEAETGLDIKLLAVLILLAPNTSKFCETLEQNLRNYREEKAAAAAAAAAAETVED